MDCLLVLQVNHGHMSLYKFNGQTLEGTEKGKMDHSNVQHSISYTFFRFVNSVKGKWEFSFTKEHSK
jgi:hypothetical protein